MAIVIRKINGMPIAYLEKELCPMLDDTRVDYDIVEAILELFYKNGTKFVKNTSMESLRELGLKENKIWAEKKLEERNEEIRRRLLQRNRPKEEYLSEEEEFEEIDKKIEMLYQTPFD